MKLRIHCHPSYIPEREYIFHVFLYEFLGIEYECVFEEREDVAIWGHGDDSSCLLLADSLFRTPPEEWLTVTSLPKAPFPTWDISVLPMMFPVVDAHLPLLFSSPDEDGNLFSESDGTISLGVDLFGTAFYLLARYEEVARSDVDVHERFPATAWASGATEYLSRPLVNEYLELLYACLQRLWGNVARKRKSFRIMPTHDIDWPRHRDEGGVRSVIRQAVGDIVKRGNSSMAIRRMTSKVSSRLDMYDTFDYIMTVVERAGLQSEFNVITDHTAGRLDGVYSLDDPWIRALLINIHKRGHLLGLHPSYHSYLNENQIRKEFIRLLNMAEDVGIRQSSWGGRQHFLRFKTPDTWAHWESAGLDYDSSLSFAQQPGFRCGVCYEYPVYDVHQRKMLRLRERPLILMEASVLQTEYMNLSSDAIAHTIHHLKSTCHIFNGWFIFLWHNSQLFTEERRQLFEYACSAIR